jgi:hydroxyacylglutathione hydrolase
LLTDTAASSHPVALLTGDFVFVGDVGRPDLLERAANIAGVMEPSARKLFESLKWFRSLPDWVLVWPAHGAGSACGKSLGGMPATSVGYEKQSNWALAIEGQEEFVQRVLEGQPDPPRYFAQMKRINKEGPRILGGFHTPTRLAPEAVFELLDQRAVIFDLRPDKEFASGHIPGTLGMQMCRSFLQYAGWFVRYDQPTYLIASDVETVQAAVRDLALIGVDDIAGWFGEDVFSEYVARRGELATHAHVTHDEAIQLVRTSHAQIVDVRSPSEYASAHMPDATNVPYYRIEQHVEKLRKDRPIVVYCNSGGRSAIAASLLSNAGFERVHDLNIGFEAYVASGGPTETQSSQPREPVTT